MRRRRALAALLAVAAPVLAGPAGARPPRRATPYRIGLIPDHLPIRHVQIADALRDLGWQSGSDYVLFQSGIPAGFDAERSVRRVVDGKPDLILAAVMGYVLIAQRLTKTIPIVMWATGYPVEAGVALSLARPGKNVTGLAIYAGTEVFGKLLDLLREAKPGIKRIDVLWSYVPPFHPKEEIEPCYDELRRAAQHLGVALRIREVARPEQTRATLHAIAAEGVHALLLTSGAPMQPHREEIMRFATGMRLPTISDFSWPGVQPQPLLRYSPPPETLLRQAATYVDRILGRGAAPAELPIQRPAKFELELNLRTATALGLEVPPSLLLRADRVVE
jgi:putative ABC transport system substrate-binding protein